MKTIYLAFKIFWKQKFLNIFLIITVMFSVYYLSPLLSNVIHYAQSLETLRCFDMDHAYYMYYDPYYNNREAKLRDSVVEKSDDLEYITEVAEFFSLYDEKNNFQVMAYNDCLIKKFKPNLQVGHWIDQGVKTGSIPAVITNDIDRNIGDEFTITVAAGLKKTNLTCVVVGKLGKNGNTVGFSKCADDEYFMADAIISSAKATIILPYNEQISRLIANETSGCSSSGCVLYTTADIAYQEVLNEFGYAGMVTDLGNGNQRFYDITRAVVSAMGVYFLIYFVIVLVCLLCSSILLNLNTKYIYTIYHMLGMSQSQRVRIESVRVSFMVLLCSGMSFLLLQKMGLLTLLFEDIHSIYVLIGIILYVSLIFIPISAALILKNNKIDIINSIRSQNQ